jgi:hypothetical protein
VRTWWWVAGGMAALAACGGPAAPPLLRGAPSSYLVTIDQLISPDFAFDSSPRSLTAVELAGTGVGPASLLTSAGLTGAATEDFFRDVPDLATLNGPVQIGDTVEEFGSAAGAATVFSADVRRLNGVPGSTAVSTGALGDAAHATLRPAATPVAGTAVVEITVEWRVNNLLNVLVVRGREGGVRPDDALLLAHRQTVAELGLATPRASRPPSPTG